jgi:hypothetical protein
VARCSVPKTIRTGHHISTRRIVVVLEAKVPRRIAPYAPCATLLVPVSEHHFNIVA